MAPLADVGHWKSRWDTDPYRWRAGCGIVHLATAILRCPMVGKCVAAQLTNCSCPALNSNAKAGSSDQGTGSGIVLAGN